MSHVEIVQRLTAERDAVLPLSLEAAACTSASTLAWTLVLQQAGVESVSLVGRLELKASSLLHAALLALAIGAEMICKRCLRQVSLECPESVLLSSATDVGAALALLPPSAQGLRSSLSQ